MFTSEGVPTPPGPDAMDPTPEPGPPHLPIPSDPPPLAVPPPAETTGPNPTAIDGTGVAERPAGFLPTSPARLGVESVFVRFIATAGIVGVATGLGAILAAADVVGWIIALVVSTISVLLAAVLWRSRRL